jgi:tetratricopeptide (TPR) repeat protein
VGTVVISLLLFGVSLVWTPALHAQVRTPSSDFATTAAKADAARDGNRLQEAVTLYRKALALRPNWAEGWWSLGTILYDQDDYAEAARAFRRLLSYDPKNGTAHLMLALCEYQLNLDDSALKHIDAAARFGIQKDAQLQHVLEYHKAMLLLRKGKYESAIDTLHFLVYDGVQSDDQDLALGMAVLLMRPANLPQEGSPERQVVLRLGQAEALSLVKNYQEARRRYSELVKEFPDFPNIHYAYGRFLLAAQDVDEAVRQFQQELKKNPKHVRSLLQIAAVHYRVDSAEGVPYAEQAVKLAPGYPFGRYLLGLLYLDSGQTARAIPELETAARLVPQEAQFQFALGTAYAKAGRKADAARARAAFRRLGGENQSAAGPDTYGARQPLNLDSSSISGNTGRKQPQ